MAKKIGIKPKIDDFVVINGVYYKKYSTADGQISLKLYPAARIRDLFPDRKDRLRIIELEGFISEPNHVNYQQIIDGKWWNDYPQLRWRPQNGEWRLIYEFLVHIFGEQIEYGLDYLQLLYLNPQQKLPILLLVSRERETGKSTFLDFLQAIFGDAAKILHNEDFEDRFNDHYALALIVGIDETNLRRTKELDKLKALSTGRKVFVSQKYQNRREVESCIHLVMCSNDLEAPVLIDKDERRFWVIEVSSLTTKDERILDYLTLEIPAFLGMLRHRQLSCNGSGNRLFFNMSKLSTPALLRIVRHTENMKRRGEKDLANMILGMMDTAMADAKIDLTLNALETYAISCCRLNYNSLNIRTIVGDWGLTAVNSSYVQYFGDKGGLLPVPKTAKGRYYTFTRSFLEEKCYDE